MLSGTPLGEWASGGATVRAYDTLDDGITPDVNDVRVGFGTEDSVAYVVIDGGEDLAGLGLSISGASRVGVVVDARSGDSGALGYLASDASIGTVVLRAGVSGAAVGESGLDVDVASDRVAVFSADSIGRCIVIGDASADIVTGGDAGVVYVTGDLTGNVSVGGTMGALRVNGALVGDVAVGGTLRGMTSYGGVTGDVSIQDSLGALVVRGGALTGDVHVGESAGVVAVIGDMEGHVSTGLDLGRLVIVNGELSSPDGLPAVEVGRDLGTMVVFEALSGDVSVGGRLGVMALRADAAGDLTAGEIGSMTLLGDFIGHITSAGDLNRLVGLGSLSSPDDAAVVSVGGDLGILVLVGEGSDLLGDVTVGGSANVVRIDGDVAEGVNIDIAGDVNQLIIGSDAQAGSHIEADGRIGGVRIAGSLLGAEGGLVQLLADDIGLLLVGGDVTNARVLAGAHLGADGEIGGEGENADTFGGGSIDRLLVRGDVTDSVIGAGLHPEDGILRPHSIEHFRDGSSIGRIDIDGRLSGSQIGSEELGDHIRVHGDDTDPWANDDIYCVTRGTWGRHWRRTDGNPGSNTGTGDGDGGDTGGEDPVIIELPGDGEVDADTLASWGIQLQGDLTGLLDSPYTLVVVDNDLGANTAAWVSALKAEGKTVVAYFSIGEAEDYRFYWDESFENGTVDFLGPENPYWPGNYKVKYWDEDWWDIALEPTLDNILAAGFDGVYLDIVDAYWYWHEQGYNARETADSMVELVERISTYAHAEAGEDFTVTPQNALGIIDDCSEPMRERYFNAIDSVGLESLFFNIWSPQDQAYRLQLLEQVAAAGKDIYDIEYIRSGQYDAFDAYIEASGLEIHGYAAAPDALLDEVVVRDAA